MYFIINLIYSCLNKFENGLEYNVETSFINATQYSRLYSV